MLAPRIYPTFRFRNAAAMIEWLEKAFGFTTHAKYMDGDKVDPTELAKIVNGEGNWLFYGHANAAGTGFDLWWLLDLRAFRAGLIRHASNGYPISSGDRVNTDGTCFKWFDIRSFPKEPPLVLATSGPRSAGPSPWHA